MNIFNQEFDLLPVDATLLIDFLNGKQETIPPTGCQAGGTCCQFANKTNVHRLWLIAAGLQRQEEDEQYKSQ